MGATMRKCWLAKQMAVVLLAIGATGRAAAAMTGDDERTAVAAPRSLDLSAMAHHDAERMTAGLPRLAEGAMAYRFRVAFTDSTGATVVAPAGWGATVYLHRAGGSDGRAIIRLSDVISTVSIPRPLGVRLAAGDSLSLSAVMRGAGAPVAVTMRLAVDVEPAPLARTRMGTSAVAWQRVGGEPRDLGSESRRNFLRDSDPESASVAWEWTPDADGRLLAMAAVTERGAMALDDVTTGVRLWEAPARPTRDILSGEAPSPVQRLGVALKAGHVYRLHVVGAMSGEGVSEPVALVWGGR